MEGGCVCAQQAMRVLRAHTTERGMECARGLLMRSRSHKSAVCACYEQWGCVQGVCAGAQRAMRVLVQACSMNGGGASKGTVHTTRLTSYEGATGALHEWGGAWTAVACAQRAMRAPWVCAMSGGSVCKGAVCATSAWWGGGVTYKQAAHALSEPQGRCGRAPKAGAGRARGLRTHPASPEGTAGSRHDLREST